MAPTNPPELGAGGATNCWSNPPELGAGIPNCWSNPPELGAGDAGA